MSGKYLIEFVQLDLKAREASREDVIKLVSSAFSKREDSEI
jgi:hypothetical protein